MTIIISILTRAPYPLTANAIAHKIGDGFTTDETIERQLRELEKQGIVSCHGENINEQLLWGIAGRAYK